MIQIRHATQDDYPFAEELLIDNMLGYYQRHGLRFSRFAFSNAWHKSENFILLKNGERCGLLRLNVKGEDVHLGDIQVKKEFQNLGIGTAMLGNVFQYAAELRAKRITLHVFKDNPAIALYERAGFEFIESADKHVKTMAIDLDKIKWN